MSYSENIEKQAELNQLLVRISPRRRVTGWTFYGNSTSITDPGTDIYVADFDLGPVWFVSVDGIADPATRSMTANGEQAPELKGALDLARFAYDQREKKLYYNFGGEDPADHIVTALYDIFVGTESAIFYRDPLGEDTRAIEYVPAVVRAPEIATGAASDLFGIVPTQGGSLSLEGVSGMLLPHLVGGSFKDATVDVFHCSGEIKAGNIARVFRTQAVTATYSREKVDFRLADRIGLLERDFRDVTRVYPAATGGGTVDPRFVGKLMRIVFGMVDGLQAVNAEYVKDAPATTDNRVWLWGSPDGTSYGQAPATEITKTVVAAPASTSTRTYLNSWSGLNVGDTFYLNSTSNVARITAVNTASNYIDHTTIGTPGTTGQVLHRGSIGYVAIFQDRNTYIAHYGRDYTVDLSSFAGYAFVFTSTLEANLSMAETLGTNDGVSCRAYGLRNNNYFNGDLGFPFGQNGERTSTMDNPVLALFSVLFRNLDISTFRPDLDNDSFNDSYGTIVSSIGFTVPKSASETSGPTVKEVVETILESALLRLFISSDGKWAVVARGPMGLADYALDGETEITDGSTNYGIDSQDMAQTVTVEYRPQESAEIAGGDRYVSQSIVENDEAVWVYNARRANKFETLLIYEDNAAALATRLGFILSRPQGLLSIQAPYRFFPADIGQVVELSQERIPGFAFAEGVTRTQKYSIAETTKGLGGITLVLDDQRGIEDNSGDW